MQPEVVTTFEPFAVSQLIANFLDRYATAPTAGTADGDGV